VVVYSSGWRRQGKNYMYSPVIRRKKGISESAFIIENNLFFVKLENDGMKRP
jgi:hypothetical protein